ncbi:chymotrypsin-1-like [Octopus vulgaris]|uniref:Chymotrypsin-1-like n=1 Tax=Octopus vulgaris TaxID=6645 RepID=A0AA36BB37_OCTVU|nr:chymotrypsin-1-like [Octopus vulgaris]
MKLAISLFVIVLLNCALNCLAAVSDRGDKNYNNNQHEQQHKHNIIGGTYATLCQFPWMVVLLITTNKGEFLCGGSIIDNQHILTAAHCVKGATQVLVSAGGNDRYKMEVQMVVNKSNIHANQNYTGPDLFQNDITVLTLPRKLIFSDCIQPIAVAQPGEKFYSNCIIAGWGETRAGKPTQYLKTARVQLFLPSECRMFFPDVTSQQVCGGSGHWMGPEACHGDSGGPLMCFNAVTEELTIVGTTSYGEAKCQNGMGVYENVAHFVSWINRMRNT